MPVMLLEETRLLIDTNDENDDLSIFLSKFAPRELFETKCDTKSCRINPHS